jgi:diadenosine tetraphosphatase ApaH/serine/threonine PP2A family protein phosphatase
MSAPVRRSALRTTCDWRAGYVILDMSGDVPAVEFARVEYDLKRTMAAIRGGELPDEYAEFLATGGLPGGVPER